MRSKIKKVIMATGFLLSITSITFSQASTDSRIKKTGLYVGFSYANLADKALNNIVHEGLGIVGGCYLEFSDTRTIKVFDLELGSGFLKSDFESEASSYRFSGSARFRWLHSPCYFSSDLNIYIGGNGEIKTAIEYFDNWDESHFYWMSAYSAGIDFRLDYSFGSNSRILIEGNMPVFSFVSRPPAEFLFTQSSPSLKDVLKDLNHDLGFILPDKYLDINFHVRYSFRNSKKFMPSIYWKINYLNIEKDDSDKLRYFDQAIGVEYVF